MKPNTDGQPPLRLEVKGRLIESVSTIMTSVADFVGALFHGLTEIVVAFTEMVVRYLRSH